MKFLTFIGIIVILHNVICEDIKNDTKKNSTENGITPQPQPLVNIHSLKNNTKDAAQRIFKLFKSSKPETNDHDHHHHFNKEIGWNIFGLQKPPVKDIDVQSDLPRCICAPHQEPRFSPIFPTVSTSFKENPSFESQKNPKFETVYPRVRSDVIETPIFIQYPPLELNSLLSYDSNEFNGF